MRKEIFIIVFFVISWMGGTHCRAHSPRDGLRDECFVKADETLRSRIAFIWKLQTPRDRALSFIHETGGGKIVGIELDGGGAYWPELQKIYGTNFLHNGDTVHRVDNCKITDMLSFYHGGFYASPGAEEGYLSKMEFVLVAPERSLPGIIHEVEIERDGKPMVLLVQQPVN